MRVALLLVVAMLALTSNAKSQSYYLIGMGGNSCAFWLSRPDYKTMGETWVFGYWSGLNAGNKVNPMVGRNTDSVGIIGEVQKVCEEEPSTSLISAASRVYKKLSK